MLNKIGLKGDPCGTSILVWRYSECVFKFLTLQFRLYKKFLMNIYILLSKFRFIIVPIIICMGKSKNAAFGNSFDFNVE